MASEDFPEMRRAAEQEYDRKRKEARERRDETIRQAKASEKQSFIDARKAIDEGSARIEKDEGSVERSIKKQKKLELVREQERNVIETAHASREAIKKAKEDEILEQQQAKDELERALADITAREAAAKDSNKEDRKQQEKEKQLKQEEARKKAEEKHLEEEARAKQQAEEDKAAEEKAAAEKEEAEAKARQQSEEEARKKAENKHKKAPSLLHEELISGEESGQMISPGGLVLHRDTVKLVLSSNSSSAKVRQLENTIRRWKDVRLVMIGGEDSDLQIIISIHEPVALVDRLKAIQSVQDVQSKGNIINVSFKEEQA
jgi:hypothetical protein